MSDKDCVSRSAVLALLNTTTQKEITNECYDRLYDAVARMDAVPHEMTTREYLETEARMCRHYGLPCAFDVSGMTVDEAIEMVEKFAREHPERSED